MPAHQGPKFWRRSALDLKTFAISALLAVLLLTLALHLSLEGNSNGIFAKVTQPDAANVGFIARQPCSPKRGLPPLKTRNELSAILEANKFRTGAEVGVQLGKFSKSLLSNWPSCVSLRLIDLWAPQENYRDSANVNQAVQDKFMEDAKKLLDEYRGKTLFMKMKSSEAAKLIDKESLDFVYIDARHDYCGVTEDLWAYWPLLRPGGIMAGHDYRSNTELRAMNHHSDWGLCENGTRIESAVKGAVDDFFVMMGLTVSLTSEEWPTWIVQKPLC